MPFQDTPVVTYDPDAVHEPTPDPISLILREQIVDQVWMAAATDRRSLQATVGPSEIGTSCDRQLAYKIAKTRPVNHRDPLRVMIGTGVHAVLQDFYQRIDGGSHRFLIEHPAIYRGVSGTADLYDSRRQVVIDWKSTTKAKLRNLKRQGPSQQYVVQAHTYGAALVDEGYPVTTVALVFVPIDGELSDIYVWTQALDVSIADKAIDRLSELERQVESGTTPAEISADPTRLCPWCSHYRPGSTDLSSGCPGDSAEEKS